MTDNVYCLVKIILKDERIIAAVQFEIKLIYRPKQLTDDIYTTDIYCKLSKYIGHTLCSYEHYLVGVYIQFLFLEKFVKNFENYF